MCHGRERAVYGGVREGLAADGAHRLRCCRFWNQSNGSDHVFMARPPRRAVPRHALQGATRNAIRPCVRSLTHSLTHSREELRRWFAYVAERELRSYAILCVPPVRAQAFYDFGPCFE